MQKIRVKQLILITILCGLFQKSVFSGNSCGNDADEMEVQVVYNSSYAGTNCSGFTKAPDSWTLIDNTCNALIGKLLVTWKVGHWGSTLTCVEP